MNAENKKNWRNAIGRYFSRLGAGDRKTYWASFGIMFAIMFLCMAASLIVLGKSFIWRDDGLTQQYTSFILLGDWYRSLFDNFFVNRTFVVPMWTEIVGYGEDLILTLSSYIANPFFLTAAIATPQNADFFLDASVFFTLLASGITFTFFARNRWSDGFATLVGCMVYVFSGFSVIAFSQIHMIYPLVLAPLVFMGADWIFDKRKPFLFIISLSLIMAYSLNTGYMCCLLLVVFCLVRFFLMSDKSSKAFLKYLLVFIGCIAFAVVISAVFFVPSAANLLSQDRIGLERDIPLLYSLRYYLKVFEGFLKYEYVGSECFIGFSPIALIALLYLISSKRSKMKTFLVASFCILTIVLLLPFLGSVFNGFAYPNNRWVWAYSLLMGSITVCSIERLQAADGKPGKSFVMLVILYALIASLFMVKAGKAFAASVIIAMILFSILVWKNKASVLWKVSVSCSLVLCCLLTYAFWLLPTFGNAASRNVDAGQAYEEAVTNGTNSVALELPDGDSRYDIVGDAISWRNAGIATGRDSVSFYNSMYNNAIDEYHSTLGLTTSPFNISFESMDSRLVMEQMAGVKYIVSAEGSGQEPALYSREVASREIGGNEYAAYESDHVLPLAFVYDAESVVGRDALEQLNAVEVQDSFLEHVAVDRGEKTELDVSDEVCESVGFTMTMQQNSPASTNLGANAPAPTPLSDETVAAFEGHERILANDGGITVDLNVDIPAGKRAYLCIKGLDYSPASTFDYLSDDDRNGMSALQRIKTQIKQILAEESSGCTITASTSIGTKSLWQPSSSTHLYGGKDSWAFNLGISDADRERITLTLNTPGFYSAEDIEVVLEDEQLVSEGIVALEEKGADGIHFEQNTLTCNAKAASDGDMLFVRLPYSGGWHANVDGNDAEVLRANIGFMAIGLTEGTHEVTLRYETPGLTVGFTLSACGICLMVAWAIVSSQMSRRPKVRANAPQMPKE